MKQIRKTITALPSGNHSINFVKSSAEEQIYTNFIVTGTQTLTGNFNINPSGTPSIYTVVDILWNADVIPSTSNVVIFGVAIPNSLLASGNFKVQCFYDALSGKGVKVPITNGWVVNIIPDASSSGDVDSTRLAADSVTTAKIADDAVTLAKMAGQTDGKVYVGDTALGVVSVAMSGDATIAKTGALTIANDAITTAKILDANVTPAKLSASSNKGQFAVQLEFDEAAKIGVIKYQICSTCTIDGIYATVNRVPATDTATVIPKNHGGVAMTGGQIDITTALALGNIVSVTPTVNNTFTAGEQMTLETSKTTAEACTITVVVCYTVTA
jgi:hypothetical protein